MSDHWDFYFCDLDGHRCSIFVDLALDGAAPVRAEPCLLWVSVDLHDPGLDGLPAADFDELHEIEDALFDALSARLGARAVGRLTGEGSRQFFFYAAKPATGALEETVRETMGRFPEQAFTSGERDDPEWRHYREFLFPSEEELVTIENQHVVEELIAHGDSLDAPRAVDHWLYFPSAAKQAEFVREATRLGFAELEDRDDDDADDDDDEEDDDDDHEGDDGEGGRKGGDDAGGNGIAPGHDDAHGHDHAHGYDLAHAHDLAHGHGHEHHHDYRSDASGDRELPFVAKISRIDDVDPESINAVTVELLRLANRFGGAYDGWETELVDGDDGSDEVDDADSSDD